MSTELERRLRVLSAHLDVPPTPELAAGVRQRIDRRWRLRVPRIGRRSVGLAFAVLLLAAGGAMAVPSVRHSVLHALGLRGAKVVRVPSLPPAKSAPLPLGRPIPVASARSAAGFRALLPPHIDAAYLASQPTGDRLSLRVGPLLLVELRGARRQILLKQLVPSTSVKAVRVKKGTRGVFISGAPHRVYFLDRHGAFTPDTVHLAGNVLLWVQGTRVLRIEGTRSLARALHLARSLR